MNKFKYLAMVGLFVLQACGGSAESGPSGSHPDGKADDPSAGSQQTEFSCQTAREEDGQTATIRFAVSSLDDRANMELVWPPESDGDDFASPIQVEPETSFAYTLVYGMADGYLEYTEGKLRIFSDQDGCEWGELVLYEDSGFERGWFKFESGLEELTFYTEVWCELR